MNKLRGAEINIHFWILALYTFRGPPSIF